MHVRQVGFQLLVQLGPLTMDSLSLTKIFLWRCSLDVFGGGWGGDGGTRSMNVTDGS
jgi:hypothetical protein